VVAARLTGCKNIVAARRLSANRIAVEAWNCQLQTSGPIPDGLTHVGIRSHQIAFQPAANGENTFPCWLVSTSEAPHEMTLYLRLQSAPHAVNRLICKPMFSSCLARTERTAAAVVDKTRSGAAALT